MIPSSVSPDNKADSPVPGGLRPALTLFLVLTMITGVLYPLAILLMGRAFFPHQARGSMVTHQRRVVGSALVGQSGRDAVFFWSRPSAIDGRSITSGGSNLSVLNPMLEAQVTSRTRTARVASRQSSANPIPVDLVTASASGLDPHISPAAALWQIPRVAEARKMEVAELEAMVRAHMEPRTWGILGEPRVNVLLLNIDLLERQGSHP
jgi:K+-transporting ATPase ATPase C chain